MREDFGVFVDGTDDVDNGHTPGTDKASGNGVKERQEVRTEEAGSPAAG
ncbi:hypothetical protein HEK616_73010 [Streptomyces nigrescens]|uniref:Uncharacterized protein n=1 Tax=Streptomyces nigrescens TaxID=1920 RepID=A0ABM8A5R2_STRNI|nr:hypothetical protein HEK616_73010 [Streptomyces nigrescens]